MSTSYLSSPDQPSGVFPDRLIRPLPRRTIKSRLSQEAAELIAYPPSLPSSDLPVYSHHGANGEYLNDSKVLVQNSGNGYDPGRDHDHDHDHDHDDDDDHEHCAHHHHHCEHDHDDDDLDSLDEPSPVAMRHANSYRVSPHSPRSRHSRYGSGHAPDGYEAFENTNNKKKRKIPTSGSMSLHHSSLTSDLASMGINGRDGAGDDPNNSYYAATSPSGYVAQPTGRNRNLRKNSARNPLGVSVNGSNVRSASSKYEHNMITSAEDDVKADQGIISKAIANATAVLRNPLGKGQENVGVLDQQNRAAATNSQFTFTCESEAKGLRFPEQSLYSPEYSQRVNAAAALPPAASNQRYSAQATQTSPNMSQDQQHVPMSHQGVAANSAQGKKPRRRKGDVYALAARQRKLQQEYVNLQQPPASEDIWICEFCEYESIFGGPPRALIRQYEIKDRRERKRLAEKQRLLEKAKLKGRKGKKQTKNAAKAANQAAQQPLNHQDYDDQGLDPADDYLDDGYDDDPGPMPAPPPPTVTKQQNMPGAYSTPPGKASEPIDRGGIR